MGKCKVINLREWQLRQLEQLAPRDWLVAILLAAEAEKEREGEGREDE